MKAVFQTIFFKSDEWQCVSYICTMGFEEYLTFKKISIDAFRKGDQARFEEFQTLFSQMHPDSFTAQKLFLINGLRRKYPVSTQNAEISKSAQKSVKPKIALPKKEN